MTEYQRARLKFALLIDHIDKESKYDVLAATAVLIQYSTIKGEDVKEAAREFLRLKKLES